jgi:hypothetical protein
MTIYRVRTGQLVVSVSTTCAVYIHAAALLTHFLLARGRRCRTPRTRYTTRRICAFSHARRLLPVLAISRTRFDRRRCVAAVLPDARCGGVASAWRLNNEIVLHAVRASLSTAPLPVRG